MRRAVRTNRRDGALGRKGCLERWGLKIAERDMRAGEEYQGLY